MTIRNRIAKLELVAKPVDPMPDVVISLVDNHGDFQFSVPSAISNHGRKFPFTIYRSGERIYRNKPTYPSYQAAIDAAKNWIDQHG